MRRALCLTLVLVMISLSGCTFINQAAYTHSARPSYQSYKKIPGVTQDEIDALEKLLANKPRLSYGVIVTTEASGF